MKWNEVKWSEMKQNEAKWSEMNTNLYRTAYKTSDLHKVHTHLFSIFWRWNLFMLKKYSTVALLSLFISLYIVSVNTYFWFPYSGYNLAGPNIWGHENDNIYIMSMTLFSNISLFCVAKLSFNAKHFFKKDSWVTNLSQYFILYILYFQVIPFKAKLATLFLNTLCHKQAVVKLSQNA